MKKPKAINLFLDAYDEFSLISDEQAGRLTKALLSYAGTGTRPDFGTDTTLMVMFSAMSKQIDRDFEKYKDTCRKRSEAGKLGGAPKNNTNAVKNKQPKTSKTSQDEDKDKDKDKDKDENEYKDKYNNIPDGAGRAGSTVYSEEIPLIINYLNQKAGTHYRYSTKSTRSLIKKRLREGYSSDDFCKVIDKKCSDWLNTEYEKFLRPDTLFSDKFESYLNAPDRVIRAPESRLHPWQNETQDGFLRLMMKYEDN